MGKEAGSAPSWNTGPREFALTFGFSSNLAWAPRVAGLEAGPRGRDRADSAVWGHPVTLSDVKAGACLVPLLFSALLFSQHPLLFFSLSTSSGDPTTSREWIPVCLVGCFAQL